MSRRTNSPSRSKGVNRPVRCDCCGSARRKFELTDKIKEGDGNYVLQGRIDKVAFSCGRLWTREERWTGSCRIKDAEE
jgi:hypothetical protein